MYSGLDNSATSSYAYMKVFDLTGQNVTVTANTVLSYWIYPAIRDLGDLSVEGKFNAAQEEELMRAYFGERLNEAKLAVMHGDAEVLDASETTTVNKNKTLTYNLAEQTPPVIAKNYAELPTDSWDHDAVQYHSAENCAGHIGQRCMRSCSGLDRGKCATRYSI